MLHGLWKAIWRHRTGGSGWREAVHQLRLGRWGAHWILGNARVTGTIEDGQLGGHGTARYIARDTVHHWLSGCLA